MERTSIDIYQPHCYPSVGMFPGRKDVDAGLLQDVHYNAMRGSKPWLLGESGGFGTHPSLGPAPDAETQRYLARDCIWFALLSRSIGASIWGIKHDATVEFKTASEIAPLVNWSALAAAKAPLGIAMPRDISRARYFCAGEGQKALGVVADYATCPRSRCTGPRSLPVRGGESRPGAVGGLATRRHETRLPPALAHKRRRDAPVAAARHRKVGNSAVGRACGTLAGCRRDPRPRSLYQSQLPHSSPSKKSFVARRRD